MIILVTSGAVIINENKKILLVLRPADKKIFPSCWALPGGKIEPWESLESAVVREVKEETWLWLSSLDKYTFTEYISSDTHNISHLFLWKYSWVVKAETKAIWYKYSELLELPLAFNQISVFDDLHKKWIF